MVHPHLQQRRFSTMADFPYQLTLVNPGAESGSATGWTNTAGLALSSVVSDGIIVPKLGGFMFALPGAGHGATNHQDVAMPSEVLEQIDAGLLYAYFAAPQSGAPFSQGKPRIEFLNGSGTLIGYVDGYYTHPKGSIWANNFARGSVPTGTRTIRFVLAADYDPSFDPYHVAWDDLQAWLLTGVDFPEDQLNYVFTETVAPDSAPPSGLVDVWGAADQVYEVIDRGDGKFALQCSSTADNRHTVLVYLPVDATLNERDAEVYLSTRFLGSDPQVGLALRVQGGSGVGGDQNYGITASRDTDDALRIDYWPFPGAHDPLAVVAGVFDGWAPGDDWNFLARLDGDNLKVKAWKDGDDEPVFWQADVDGLDSLDVTGWAPPAAFAFGHYGVYRAVNTGTDVEVACFGIGVNGAAAPRCEIVPDIPPTDCNNEFRLTLFEKDDVTPILGIGDGDGNVYEGSFYTGKNCIRPFLKWPESLPESEVDFQEGKSIIGQISLGILDKRVDAADQTTGIVTSIIDKLRDARALLERYSDGEWRVILEGVLTKIALDDSLVSYTLSIRDIRERERDYSLFTINETWAVWPERGSANGYGLGIGGGEALMPIAATFQGVYTESFDLGARRSGYVLTDEFFEDLDQETKTIGEPRITNELYVPVATYPSLTVRWRLASDAAADCPGSPATTRVTHMLSNAPGGKLAVLAQYYAAANGGASLPSDPVELTEHAMGGDDCLAITAAEVGLKRTFLELVAAYGGSSGEWKYLRDAQVGAVFGAGNFFVAGYTDIYGVGTLGLPTNYVPQSSPVKILMEGVSSQLPAPGADIEVQVLARRVTKNTPLVWEGSFGKLLRLIYDGFFTDGAPSRVLYNANRMAVLEDNTPMARMKLTEPVADGRTWTEEHIFKVLGMAPALDERGRVYPISYARPATGADLPVLDDSNLATSVKWEAGWEGVISQIEFVYIRESSIPVVTTEELKVKKTGLFGIDWLSKDGTIVVENTTYTIVEDEETQVFVYAPAAPGRKLSFKPATVRALGSVAGHPMSADSIDETGAQIAAARASEAFSRFSNVMPRLSGARVPASDPAADMVVGDWCVVKPSWLPDPVTLKRGMKRIMQVTAKKPRDKTGFVEFRLVDGGEAQDEALATNLTVDPDPFFDGSGIPTVTVVSIPVGYTGRIDWAVSFAGEPATDSPDWKAMALNLATTGEIKAQFPPPTSAPVFVRWRIEKAGQQPGPWSDAFELDGANETPILRTSKVAIDLDTGDVVVSWSAGNLTAGVKVWYAYTADGVTPDLTVDYVSVDASDGTVTLPTPITIGDVAVNVTVILEPWSVFSGGAVSGTEGSTHTRSTRYPGKTEIPASESGVDAAIAALTFENVNTGGVGVYKERVSDTFRFRGVNAASPKVVVALDAGTNEIRVDVDAENVGTGDASLLVALDPAEKLQFKKLRAGTDVILTDGADYVQIDAVGADGGEDNTASNVGGEAGVYKEKVGVDLRFRSIESSDATVVVTENADTIDLTIPVTGAGETWSTAAPSGTPVDKQRWVQYIGSSLAYRAEVLADTPTIFLPLDENTGTVATDLSGNGNDGTYQGTPALNQASIVTGDVAAGVSSVDFAGGSRYVSLPSLSMSNKSFTLEMWIKAQSVGTQQSFWLNGDTQAGNKYLHCGLLSSGLLYFNFYSDDMSAATNALVNATIYHIVHRYDYVADLASIWLNGIKIKESSVGPLNDAGTHTTEFGRTFGGSPIKSIAQDVAIYNNIALSDARIKTHYAAGALARIASAQWMYDAALAQWLSVTGIVN